MAFNLQARGEFEVFYMICGSPDDQRKQGIVAAYANRFKTFQVRVLASRKAVFQELDRRRERGAKQFVVYLDEFPRLKNSGVPFVPAWCVSESGRDPRELLFTSLRNVFRVFQIAVVINCTSGTAQGLAVGSTCSRTGPPYVLCVTIPSLPCFVANEAANCVPVALKKILEHSRPLFAELALVYAQMNPFVGDDGGDPCAYLNAMVSDLAPRFRSLKKLSDEFEIGQLCLLLGANYQVDDAQVNLIDGHFASLCETADFKLEITGFGEVWKGLYTPWECRCVLPPPTEELLLHLAMMGGASCRAFAQPLHQVLAVKMKPLVVAGKAMGPMEALTTAAIVLASHAGGFGGVAFPVFLTTLLCELGVWESPQEAQLLPVEVNMANQLVVPFLSPPNVVWPEWLKSESMRFENLSLTHTMDRIDFRTAFNQFSVMVTADGVKDILVRMPQGSVVHVVVTKKVQQGCCANTDAFKAGEKLAHVAVYHIAKRTAFQEVEGGSNKQRLAAAKAQRTDSCSTPTMSHRANKLVLVIEIGEGGLL